VSESGFGTKSDLGKKVSPAPTPGCTGTGGDYPNSNFYISDQERKDFVVGLGPPLTASVGAAIYHYTDNEIIFHSWVLLWTDHIRRLVFRSW